MNGLKRVAGLAGVASVLAVSGVSLMSSPAMAADDGCNGVLSGADNPNIVKTVTGAVDNHDGTFTINFSFTSTRPDGAYDQLRDCAFVDTNANGAFDSGETMVPTIVKPYTLVDGMGTGSYSITAKSGDKVCDRVALSGTDATTATSFTDKSNVACVTLGETPVPAGSVGAIGATALGGVAMMGTVLYRRRRQVGNNA